MGRAIVLTTLVLVACGGDDSVQAGPDAGGEVSVDVGGADGSAAMDGPLVDTDGGLADVDPMDSGGTDSQGAGAASTATLTDCLAISDNPGLSCTELCAQSNRSCVSECHAELVLPGEVIYYTSADSCERDELYAVGSINTCDDALGSSLLVGIVSHARCCCGDELGDGGLGNADGIVQCTDQQKANLPDDMVCVPEGEFEMGANQTWQGPVRQVMMPTYFIDRHHVTVEQYEACVGASGCTDTDSSAANCNQGLVERAQHPINCASWLQAEAYCGWAGKRLPSEAEWAKAARGTDGRSFPWGQATPTCFRAVMSDGTMAGCGTGATMPVGSKSPAGDSPYGATDMCGNVWDWTADWYADDFDPTDLDNPQGPAAGIRNTKVQRGGDYVSRGLPFLAITYRIEDPLDSVSHVYGFRCALMP